MLDSFSNNTLWVAEPELYGRMVASHVLGPRFAKQKQNKKDMDLAMCICEHRMSWYLPLTDEPTEAQRSKVTFLSSHSSGDSCTKD